MSLSYPAKTIWYVEAEATDGRQNSQGSAVAIRLQKKNDPNSAKTHLLTCAHVVRGTSADGKAGLGPALPRIRAWPPDTGFNDREAKAAKIKFDIKDFRASDAAVSDHGNAAEDWVVLEIVDAQAATAAPAVNEWGDAEMLGPFRIYGYPGGDASFPHGKVLPIATPDPFPFRDDFHGALRLTGDGTRPGISGGGVFDEPSLRFAGIHRSRDDGTLRLHAVSARMIRDRLFELGYEVIAPRPDKGSTLVRRRRAINLAVKLTALVICVIGLVAGALVAIEAWFPNPRPRQLLVGETTDVGRPGPLYSLYQTRHSSGMNSLIRSVEELADSEEHGVVFVSTPLEKKQNQPAIDLEVRDSGNGNLVNNPDDLVDVHWLAPNADSEEVQRWVSHVHLRNGTATLRHDGKVPAGTIIAIVYHHPEPRQTTPQIYLWLK